MSFLTINIEVLNITKSDMAITAVSLLLCTRWFYYERLLLSNSFIISWEFLRPYHYSLMPDDVSLMSLTDSLRQNYIT